MTFIELPQKRAHNRNPGVYLGDKIKIAFLTLKSKVTNDVLKNRSLLVLYIGTDIATQLGLKEGDRLSIAIDDMFPQVWHLTKRADTGWKLIRVNKHRLGKNAPLKVQLTWSQDIPSGCDGSVSKFASWDIFAGGIRLYLPGMSQEQKNQYFEHNH